MKMNLNLLRILFAVFLFIFFSYINKGFSQEPTVNLSPQEQTWLKEHPDIVLAMEGNYPPFTYTDSNDQLVGFTVDIVKLVEEGLGYTFTRYENRSWSDLYAAAKKREVDVVATMLDNPERRKWFAFSDNFVRISQVIVTAASNNEITSKNDLNYRKLAFVKDYGTNMEIMEAVPDAVPVFYDTALRGLLGVSAGEADAFIMGSGAMQHLIAQNNIGNVKVAAYYAHETANQGFGVRKDWRILVTILNKALRSIPEEEMMQLRYKWMPIEFGFEQEQKRTGLTAGERTWLKDHPVIKLGSNPSRPPYDYLQNGKHSGVASDIISTLSKEQPGRSPGPFFQKRVTAHVGRNFSPRSIQDRGSHVDMANELIADNIRKNAGTDHDHWNMHQFVIEQIPVDQAAVVTEFLSMIR